MNRSKKIVVLLATILTAATLIVAPAWADNNSNNNGEGAKADGSSEQAKGLHIQLKDSDPAKWSDIELK